MTRPDVLLAPLMDPADDYTFMEVCVKDRDGNPANEKFFVGVLPAEGQAVEIVFVGMSSVNPGGMRFQLRTKET